MFGFLRARPAAESLAQQPPASQIGCFGKLPIQSEYIRHNVARREARALDQWLQEGVGLAARSLGREGEAPADWSHHGVFAGTEEQRPVLFTLRPSRDRSGRQYPFAVFEVLGSQDRDASPGLLPLRSEAFFEAATAVMSQPWSHEPLATVIGWIDRIGEQPRLPARAALADLGAARLLDELYPGIAADARMSHLQRSVELLRQVERRTAPRVPWGVRLPLASAAPAAAISWWLRLAENVLGRRNWRPCYFWPAVRGADGTCGDLLLFFRIPPAQVAVHLLRGRGLNGTVVNPHDEACDAAAPSPIDPSSTTAQSLLARLTGRGTT